MNDFNVQYAKLDKSKVKITLRDIWTDYKHFRTAYYYHDKMQIPKDESVVDPKQFSLKNFLWDFLYKSRGDLNENATNMAK